MKLRFSFILLLAGLIQACATAPRSAPESRAPTPPARPAPKPAKPAPKPPTAQGETGLSDELLYYLLSAEIAGQRRQYKISAALYLKAAELSRDPQIAARATRVAIYAGDDARALKAARLWLELEPESVDAAQVMAVMLLRQNKVDAALPYLDKVLAHPAAGKGRPDGYMLVTSLLSKEKNPERGLTAMRRLVDRHPGDAKLIYAYAHLAMLVGKLELAERIVNQLLAGQPDMIDAWLLKANILNRQGRNAEALQFIADAVARWPDAPRLRLFYARKLVDMKRYAEAREQFARLLEQRPGMTDAIYALGLLNLQLKEPARAREYFRQLIEAGQRVDEANYYIAQAWEMEKQYDQAIQHYQAVGQGELYVDSRIRMANLLAEQGDIDAARQVLQNVNAPTLDGELRLYLAEGEILSRVGRYQDAWDVYTLALQEMPDNPQLLYARAMVAEKLDRLDEAIADLEKMVKADPENPEALNALGYTLVDRTHRIEEGMRLIRKALAKRPDDPAIMDSMGWALYRAGQPDKALAYLRKAYHRFPDAEIGAHLGEVLWVLGRHDEARRIWQESRKREPKNPVLLNTLERFTP